MPEFYFTNAGDARKHFAPVEAGLTCSHLDTSFYSAETLNKEITCEDQATADEVARILTEMAEQSPVKAIACAGSGGFRILYFLDTEEMQKFESRRDAGRYRGFNRDSPATGYQWKT